MARAVKSISSALRVSREVHFHNFSFLTLFSNFKAPRIRFIIFNFVIFTSAHRFLTNLNPTLIPKQVQLDSQEGERGEHRHHNQHHQVHLGAPKGPGDEMNSSKRFVRRGSVRAAHLV